MAETYREDLFQSRTLMLMPDGFIGGDYYSDKMRSRGIDVDGALAPLPSRALRAVRRLHLMLPAPLKLLWFGGWKEQLDRQTMVIVHGSDRDISVANYVRKKLPGARVIFWLWNPTTGNEKFMKSLDKSVELWSFDAADCARLGMRHNSTYSFRELVSFAEANPPVGAVDLYFFGAEKGRMRTLAELSSSALSMGLTVKFEIVSPHPSDGPLPEGLFSAAPVSYEKLLSNTAAARAVVEVVQEGQEGMTLRALEALFMGKKLVTNSQAVRDSALFDPSWVFFYGERDISELPAFLSRPTERRPEELIDYYDFDGWLTRFHESLEPPHQRC